MLKNGPTITATVLLSGAAAAMIALSSPAFARGGGHHQGECERYSGHECGHFDHGEHHLRGNHERPFEDYHHSGYQPGIEYPSYQRGGPSSSGVSPASGQPNPE